MIILPSLSKQEIKEYLKNENINNLFRKSFNLFTPSVKKKFPWGIRIQKVLGKCHDTWTRVHDDFYYRLFIGWRD